MYFFHNIQRIIKKTLNISPIDTFLYQLDAIIPFCTVRIDQLWWMNYRVGDAKKKKIFIFFQKTVTVANYVSSDDHMTFQINIKYITIITKIRVCTNY